ncbi:flagellar basal body rod protein FlgB [Haliovirga abyssi]|uniref:Flagellar basal body rod protein FlgB n=1 Tax=Haliovirga abyssi TaxID=2996794 RepID=A0AAU9DKQ4_9FUSO|nr:flagellar basal body rod protein FlgB [Haliovirga abyssi]BDU50487.1 flagellar basal-body rod protein FlgB [Haliovirga abyssi]
MKLFSNNITILEKGLDAYSKRANVLANNIANVNTPNYKREDIQFESILRETLSKDNSEKIKGVTTNSKHFEINSTPSLENIGAKIIREDNTTMRNDGNSVDIEKEQGELAKNNIRYQFAATRLTQNFFILKSVIKGK